MEYMAESLLDGIDDEVLIDIQAKLIAGTISVKEFVLLNEAIRGIVVWCAKKAAEKDKTRTFDEVLNDKTTEAWQKIKKWDSTRGKLSAYLFASLPYVTVTKKSKFNTNAISLDTPVGEDDEQDLYSRTADKKQDAENQVIAKIDADSMLKLAENVLTPHQLDILVRHINGWTDMDLAREFGTTGTSVCIQRHNALKKIRLSYEHPEMTDEIIRRAFSRYVWQKNKREVAAQEEIFDKVLTPLQKTILEKHLQGISQVKIAKELNITAGAVQNSMEKSLKKLRVLREKPDKLAHISKRTFIQDTHLTERLSRAKADGMFEKVLHPEQIEICNLYLDGKTQNEVGILLGKSKESVGWRIRKAMESLDFAYRYPDKINVVKKLSKSKAVENGKINALLEHPEILTPYQLRVLQEKQAGKSSTEIGAEFGVTRSAVNFQIRRAVKMSQCTAQNMDTVNNP